MANPRIVPESSPLHHPAYNGPVPVNDGREPIEAFPLTPFRILPDARSLGEGEGARFRVVVGGVSREAFVVRFHGGVHGYVNTCRHQGLTLDFGDAHFFDDAYDSLVCCHHGARYRPETGECVDGPCVGGWLTRLAIEERDGALWCVGVNPILPGAGSRG